MPIKVVAAASLRSALRPAGLTTLRPPSIRSIPPRPAIPSEPGCSRWASCTCCRSSLGRRTYFSSNPHTTIPNDEEESATVVPLPHRARMPHLPLPPSLPYSPTSHPFRRHLEILSLSLFSSPNESWSVYTALHPSLRQYIPDQTFRSLLAQQTRHEEPALGWHRAKVLLRLAKKCRMELEDLGLEDMTNILRLGLKRILEDENYGDEAEYKLVRRLWTVVTSMESDLARVPRKIRRDWLRVQIARLQNRRKVQTRISTVENHSSTPMEEEVLNMVERGGGSALGYYIGRILFLSRGTSVEGLRESFRLMAWSLSRGTEVHPAFLFLVMRKLLSGWDRAGKNGRELLKAEIPIVLAQVEASPTSSTAQQLQDIREKVEWRSLSRSERAMALLASSGIGLPGMIGKGISIIKTSKKNLDPAEAIEAALRLLESSLRHHDADQNALITSISTAIYSARRSPRISPLVIRFVRLVHESGAIPQLPSDLTIPLFRLLLVSMPSAESYILARKIYEYARAADPPFLWSQHNIDAWRKLYKFSITSLHLHFASRLYADLMADGLAIRRTDALMMIRAIGTKPSPSRPILLERHIKDYLWVEYGRQPAFITALVQGLTKSSVKDAELALNLAQRLAEDKSLQPVVVQLIIAQLARSSRPEHRAKTFNLLRSLEPGADATWAYNTVLSYLVSAGRTEPAADQLSRNDSLGHAIALYKEMLSNRLQPNVRTISTMLRGLLDNGYVDSALAVFNTCIEQRYSLKSSAVGRLMVRLALDGRADDALVIEKQWRDLSAKSKGISWDRGVVGARVLLDVQQGKQVDLEAVAKRTGWNGTPAFLDFIESLKPPSCTGRDVSAEMAPEPSLVGPTDIGGVERANHQRSSSLSFWNKGKEVDMYSTGKFSMGVVF
ncbi:hypothetical protein CI109_102995 [Kwoniella shandongensis]|uniref:Uncharacterized protein n=1 Tax=Kwoniella shandongensis TaxID=1734106 RepID=A0A5M6C8V2_9TREE|nr:uncharacterized protein CI109_000182 [Kwoniella shandongensis]KAA5531341.1 hypothetical protein CI109_000182 [Kwoniella shandongensis]